MANRYQIATELTGFVSVGEDGGKFNNRTFAYQIPAKQLEQIEADREELLEWAKSKATGRVQIAMTPWDDQGVCKYTYGAGDGSRKAKPEPVFVDSNGDPIDKSVLMGVRGGTKVNLIIQQKPYCMGPNVGTSMRVVGVQIVELVSGNGTSDSGDLSVEDVASMFGKVDGFKADSPAVRPTPVAEGTEESYNF